MTNRSGMVDMQNTVHETEAQPVDRAFRDPAGNVFGLWYDGPR